ncbi:tripartite tricarboxylate transporter substrate binding protein [Bacillus mesophilum]|uniref:Tripartite tricarboxylate transporter substrate binding protein n=1 Tax=Bacillus mesophilum TaxID=1071718 RepID=A0A7V7RQN4_9BACI|nr:tripartite tricarboxylate transporter substrate-binding protein [Bacillus mesophilum]KAB2335778.1 tripartite tricarboxylate transporter substrate binding protein [Bacillus mesophilum]
MKKSACLIVVLLFTMILSACSSSSAGNGGEYPTGPIEFVVGFSPGGAADGTMRALQKALQDEGLIDVPITVINKPGGAGEIGRQYLSDKGGHTIGLDSSLLISNYLLEKSDLNYESFIPLATLTTEWQAVVVPKGSKVKTGEEIMNKLKEDPTSLKIGIASGLGSDDHLSFVEAAMISGVETDKLQFLVYESGGDLITALSGGHVDIGSTSVSEASEQAKADMVDIVVVSAEERVEGVEDVPTWKEEGVDAIFAKWRGITAGPNMSDQEVEFWDNLLAELVETDSWKKVLENNGWDSFYKDSSETLEFYKEETEQYEELLQSSGLK